MKEIGIITYNARHLKTEQILNHLLYKYKPSEIKIFLLPFKKREKRKVLFEHRPNQDLAVNGLCFAKQYGIEYKICDNDTEVDNTCKNYLITGAGIVSPECVREKTIINCHPGIIPNSRGLDAFKWAILEQKPVGNTLHLIDENVDSGKIISILSTPLFEEDTIYTFAERHYRNEIFLMSNFDHFIMNPINHFKEIEVSPPKMRMDIKAEKAMLDIFEEYKVRYASKYSYEMIYK